MDVYSKKKRSEIMSRIKGRYTAPEEKIALLLKTLQIRYRRNVKTLSGQPDFVISSAKTLIFVHGCFWHGHSKCNRAKLPETNRDFWKKKIQGNKKRDIKTTRILRRKGWHVITIWQCKLNNLNIIANRLKQICK